MKKKTLPGRRCAEKLISDWDRGRLSEYSLRFELILAADIYDPRTLMQGLTKKWREYIKNETIAPPVEYSKWFTVIAGSFVGGKEQDEFMEKLDRRSYRGRCNWYCYFREIEDRTTLKMQKPIIKNKEM